ncbi:MFS transporter [Candidatus Hydrogenosomobacter endosymbioticus]|uniref:Major facilitator superfamily (MFS) profile domain-containing protein n=1 Tax=Candidatus Hydrogenosomobacter endosymbioticus TaxID=2558174 RepID=A0ABN6L267_9PROT|nr:MFS transporter [Candidatus Hydrogenosomobacter endosymbioticus]BDB95909.1 hypothetical protein HYD_0420 [Candidatus Hydrogenosomobacter endosymbioticus]
MKKWLLSVRCRCSDIASSAEGSGLSVKTTIAVLAGNFLEYFDLLLFAHMLFIISPLFFPNDSKGIKELFEITSFALGWFVRPIAALIFGYVADFISRKKMLIASTVMMGVSTLMIASAPTYQSIGIWASLIILFCRFLQGFSNVGEFVGSTVYIVENAPPKYVNFFSSLVYVSSTLGGLCAALCGSVCVRVLGENPGWRAPFYIGSCIMLLGVSLRRLLPDDRPKIAKKIVLWRELWDKKWPAIGGVFINMCHPIVFYMVYTHIPKILKEQISCSADGILLQSSVVLLYEIFVVAALGYAGDMFNIVKVAYLRSASVVLLAAPCAALIVYGHANRWLLLAAQIALISISHAELPVLASSVKCFSWSRVYSSFGFVWGIGRSIMYGLGPFLFGVSQKYCGKWGFAVVLMWMAASYAIGVFCLFKKPGRQKNNDEAGFVARAA